MDLDRKTLRGNLFLFFLPLFLFIFTSLIFSNCARKKERKQLVVVKDEFEKVEVGEFVLDEKTGQEFAKNQILIYIVGNSKSELENKKAKVSEFLKAKKGEFSVLGEIEFLSEKGKVGVLLQAKVPAQTPEEIKQIVLELRNFDGSIRAFPNMRMKPNAVLDGRIPLDPLFDSWEETPGGNNWHFEAVNMPGLWKMETEGKVPVAVIEFGIRKHEDLEYDLRRGVDGEGADWAQNHGVSVLGVLGAVGNNSKGIAGTIWRGDIKAYVIDGTLSSLIQSIVFALEDEAKVILFAGGLEWGSVNPEGNPEAEAILEYHREIFSVVFQYVRYYDGLFVQSAGNEGRDARYAGVGASVKDLFPHNILLVGSTNILGKISSFSNRGSLVDLYLPGESIFTTCAGSSGNYCLRSGTSYSAAMGAGVAVLVGSINEDLKSGEIKEMIMRGMRVEGEGENARYVIDFSVSGDLAILSRSGNLDLGLRIPELGDIVLMPWFQIEREAVVEIGNLGPKAVECAVYDNTTADGDPAYKAPKCPENVEGCSSCGLLDGNGNGGYPEPNQPNTLYGLGQDIPGTGANAPIRIISIQVETMSESGFIQSGPSAGDRRNIKVTVRAWGNNPDQWIDVFYTSDANAGFPGFTLGSYRWDCGGSSGWGLPVVSGTVMCSRAGNETTVSFLMSLPAVTPPRKMAIRARIRNSPKTDLDSWRYRKGITINNSLNSNTLTDYQVLIQMDTASLISQGKMRSDCGDIRFTDEDGQTLINYWIESGCNTTSTKIWVKVPSIPASSTKTIYVYYGNPSATSASDGEATFDFFDDFEGASLDTRKWVAYANSYSVSNSVLRVNIGGIERTSAFSFNIQDGYMVETKVIHYALAANYGGVLPEVASSPFTAGGNANADATILYMREVGIATVYYWIGNGASASYNVAYASTGWISSDNTWYITGVSVRGGEVKLWRDGTAIVTVTGITWYKDLKYVKLGSFHRNAAYDLQDTGYDWVRVRKYTSPEPTASVGAEETGEYTFANYWRYRKAITINNSGNLTTLTDYQVLVQMDTASLISGGKMRGDCGDIRFTDSDGQTLLSYWIEGGCNTSSTRIWVKVPTIPASSTKTIYVYYGNPNAGSLSNGDNTFLFFDDFDDGTNYSDKWEIIRGNAGTEIVQQNGQLILDGNGPTTNGITVRTKNQLSLPNDLIVETLVYSYDWDEWVGFFLSSTNDINSGNGHGFDDGYDFGFWGWNGANHDIRRWDNGAATMLNWPAASAATNNAFYRLKGVRNGNNLNGYINNNLITSATDATYTTGWQRIMLMVWDRAKWGYDWFLVRKYTSPEPTASVGAEETGEYTFANYWRYRKAITINNSGSTTLTDYQVLIQMDTASLISQGKMRGDCGDIRFTDSDGQTLLSYWIEGGCNTSSTRIWVKVPTIPASSTKTIYVYYGNPNAGSLSNGDNTFLFFDDFDDGTNYSDKWEIIRGNAGTEIVQQNGQLILDGNGPTTNGITVRTKNQLSLPNDLIVETLVYSYDWDEWVGFFLSSTNDINSGNGHGFDDGYDFGFWGWNGANHDIRRWDNGAATMLNWPAASAATNNAFYRLKGVRNGNNLNGYINNNLITSATDATYTTGWQRIMLMVWDRAKWGYDWFLVRKYTSPEPTASVGAEETGEYTFANYWRYRKAITINNSGSTTLTDYQVLIQMDTASLISQGKMRGDCGDIRFTDSDGQTLLSYWIEGGCNTSSTRIWVKVPTIPASSTKTIYVYYGNPSATSLSSVANTFIRKIDGVVGSWHFDEGSGTIAYDSSGNNNNGTLYNSPSWVDGKFGKALSFDGVDDYVEIPDAPSLQITNAITISAWLKFPVGVASGKGVVQKYPGGGDYDYMLYLSLNGYPSIYFKNPAGTAFATNYPVDHRDNNWHHWVGTFDGRYLKIYVDGVLRNTTDTGGTTIRVTSGQPLHIMHGWSGYLNGIIDEVHIYNRALSGEEIQDLYNYYGYTTTNYPGRVLVRKFASPEPTASVGAEEETTIEDNDDLVFTVQNPPSSFSCGAYDSNFQAPVCYGDGWCGTCNAVPCRDSTADSAESPSGFYNCGGNEPNQPNTLFSQCQDTSENTPNQLDEQIRRINIKSLAPSGKFEGGELVEVSLLVACRSDDQIVIAYASGVTYSPTQLANWRYVTTIYCPSGAPVTYWYNLHYTLRLDNVEGWHAVRAVLGRCPGCATQTSICPSMTYQDADDFVFYVKAKPPSSLPVCAVYDSYYKTPKCPQGASACSTCELIKSRDSISGTAEQNQPNTLSSACSDDGPTSAQYLQTESIERIEIKDLSGSGTFQPGGQVEVSVLVYCDPVYPNYLTDYLVLLYSSNANSPTFTRVLTATCTSAGYNLFRTNITLANVAGKHVVRAIFKQGAISSTDTCAGGLVLDDGDTDDLVFDVGVVQAPPNFKLEGIAPDSITLNWSDVAGETRYEIRWTDTYTPDYSKWQVISDNYSANSTWYLDSGLSGGEERCYAIRACNASVCSDFVWDCTMVPTESARCAVFDRVWRVPRCEEGINKCSTCNLVLSRDSLASRQEINTPNAWYSSSCTDGGGGDYYSTRSVERIVLSTGASAFSTGNEISVRVRVFCSSTADYVHLYVSAGTSPISWSQAGISPSPSQACSGSNQVEDITFSFTPSVADWYVVRAVVTYSTASTCSGGSQDEVDDVVVSVVEGLRPPYNLSVTAYSTETITQYVVSFIDDSGNEDGFAIERSSDGVSWTRYEWWSDSTTKPGTGSRRIEFSLSSETRWCFRVASFKQVGSSLVLSQWADNATRCVIGVKAPSNLYVESVPVLRTLRFFWQDNSSYESGQNFEWRHSASSSYNQDSLGQNTAYYEKQFPSESVYCFRVTNWWIGDPSKPEEQGSYSQGYSGEVCQYAIGSPYPLYATFSSSGIRLDWQDNATSDVTYLIQVTNGSNWTTFQEVSSNTANYEFDPNTAHPAISGGRYCYRVRVKSGAVQLWTSNVVCVNYGNAACSGVMNLNVGVGSALKSVLSDGDMVFVAFADKVLGVSKPVVSWGSASVNWSWTLGTQISSNICSLSHDRIFIGADSKIYVIRKGDGTILSERAFGSGPVNNGCAVSGGKIYLTTSTGYVWKLSPDLKVEGVANAGSAVTTPVIDEREGGYIYVPRTDGVLKVYDLNLVEVGSVNLGSPITYVVLGPKRGEVFAAGEGGNYLYRVTRAGTSFFAKSVDVGGAIRTSPVVYQYGAEVTVIVGLDTGVLKAYGVDSSGNFVQLWSQTLGVAPRGAAVLAGDVVFIGVGNQIQARKVSDGTPVGGSCPYTALGNISTALDVEGSDVVFGDETGRLYIIAGGVGESKGWWVSYNMKGKRAIGGIYTHRGLAYEEARYCPYSPTSSGYIFSVIADEIRSDYDGKEIFAFDNKGWRGYLISATGQIIWEAYLGWRSWSLPAVGDIIPGGSKEIAMGMEDARVVVLRSDGGWYQILLCGEIRAVTLADVDGNGDDEIIATSQGCNKTYVIDWDGASLKLLREYELSSDSGNNSYAVVITYPGNSTIYVAGFSGNLYMFDYANYSTSVVSVAGSSVKLHTPAIGDVDGDGAKEVVVGGDNGVIYIRDVDGTSKGVVDITSYTGGVGKCMNRISLGDADRDGRDEIYVVASDCTATTGNSYLVSITHFGGGYQVRWGSGPFRGTSSSHVVIGDFDGDGMGDIATVVHYDDLYVWRLDGSMNFVGRAYYSGGGARGGMSVIDLDEDGRQNIIFGDRSSGCVHIFEFGEGTASGEVWWGYNRGNPKQNGVR
jgi:hypothetical protein